MNFGRKDQEDEVIRLLGRLKDAAPEYPANMYSRRRASVMAGFVALHLGASIAGLSLLAQLAKILKGMGIVEKIILGVEVAAVTGLTGYGAVTAYVYRDQLKEMLFPSSLSGETPFPSLSIPSPLSATEQSASATSIAAETGTVTATVTPLFTLEVPPTEASNPGNPISTPAPIQPPPTSKPPPPPTNQPPPQPTRTHGLHLGQTKTPQAP